MGSRPIENINIFTPNNDGLNDFFIPINLEQYPDPTLIILTDGVRYAKMKIIKTIGREPTI